MDVCVKPQAELSVEGVDRAGGGGLRACSPEIVCFMQERTCNLEFFLVRCQQLRGIDFIASIFWVKNTNFIEYSENLKPEYIFPF